MAKDAKGETDPPSASASLTRVAQGRWVEEQISAWLEQRDLSILEKNYRVPGGELDLVARRPDGLIVVVEVRSRGLHQPGAPEDTLSQRKQAFIRRATTRWLLERDLWERVPVRFDVVAVDTQKSSAAPGVEIVEIRWIKNAFEAPAPR